MPADPESPWPQDLSPVPDCRVRRRLRVAVVGEFSSGKSTLLNSLLARHLLAVGPNPTTERAHVLTAGGATDRDRGSVALEVTAGRLFELGLELWDSPGVNVERRDHEERAREVVAAVDLVLIVVRSDDASTRSAQALVARIDRERPGRAPHPVIVTRVDQIDSDDEDALMEELEEKRQEVVAGFGRRDVFLVDARDLTRFDAPRLTSAIEGWVESAFCAAFERELANQDHWMRGYLASGGAWSDALPTRRLIPDRLRLTLDKLQATRDQARQRRDAAHAHAELTYRREVRRAVAVEARLALRGLATKHAAVGRAMIQASRNLLAEAHASLAAVGRGMVGLGWGWIPLAAVLGAIGFWFRVAVTNAIPAAVLSDPTAVALRRDSAGVLVAVFAAPFALYLLLRLPRMVMALTRGALVAAAVACAGLVGALHAAFDLGQLAWVTSVALIRAGARTDWLAYRREGATQEYRAALGMHEEPLSPPVVRLLAPPDLAVASRRGARLTSVLATMLLPGAATIALVALAVSRVSNVPTPDASLPSLATVGLRWGLVVPGVGPVDGPAGLRMVPVRGGPFRMGGGDDAAESDEGVHDVVVSRSFLLSDAEVTQATWEAVMTSRPWSTRAHFWDEDASDDACSTFDSPGLPAVCVSWLDAVAFCNALSDAAGLGRAYEIDAGRVTWRVQSEGYRLPTEAEWEFAARAGTNDPWGRSGASDVCSAGVLLDRSTRKEHTWIKAAAEPCDDGFPSLAPAREAPGNRYGVHGLVGNVWEWVFDGYGAYGGESIDPVGPSVAARRGIRGGAWFKSANDARVSNRESARAAGLDTNVGIRVARGPYGAADDVVVELPSDTVMASAFVAAQDANVRGARDDERDALLGCLDHPRLGGRCRLRLGQLYFDERRWAEAVTTWLPLEGSGSRTLRANLASAQRKLGAHRTRGVGAPR